MNNTGSDPEIPLPARLSQEKNRKQNMVFSSKHIIYKSIDLDNQ